METSFPNGVKDDNFLDFDDKFLELLSQTLVTENGQYGALQYVVSDAFWNTLPGNSLGNDLFRQPVAIPPEPAEQEPDFPADGASQTVYNAYAAKLAQRNRHQILRATLLSVEQIIFAFLIDRSYFSEAVVNKVTGTGNAATRASETSKIRYARLTEQLNRPSAATLKNWKAAFSVSVNGPIVDWIALANQNNKKLEMTGDQFTDKQKVNLLETVLNEKKSTEALRITYHYKRPNPSDRTWDDFCEHLETQKHNIETELPRDQAGYSAMNCIYTQTDMDNALRDQLEASATDAHHAMATMQRALLATNGGGKQPSRPGRDSSGHSKFSRTDFSRQDETDIDPDAICWFHGKTGHWSSNCNQLKKANCEDRARPHMDTRAQRRHPLLIGAAGTISREQARSVTSVNQFPQFPGNAYAKPFM